MNVRIVRRSFAPIASSLAYGFVFALSAVAEPVRASISSAPPCESSALALAADIGNGEFTGMSHAGARLTVTNTSAAECTMPRRVTLAMLGTSGRTLPIVANYPGTVGMHPGPVLVPLALAPGAKASTVLRWVSSNVFDGGRCIAVKSIRVTTTSGANATAPLGATVCGPASGVRFDAGFFAR